MAKKKTKISLSGHVLSVNTRVIDRDLFDFDEFEPYVKALTGDREYQYKAIQELLIYLWGGRYKNIVALAEENYIKPEKEALRQRFQSQDHFLATLPLPDRLSGVCHMATGTGKSYVMFAIAHISLLLEKVDRVLVLGPSSIVIEQGLTKKFNEYLYGETAHKLKEYLPPQYRQKVIKLLNANDPIEDDSIVIENINAVYAEQRNSLGDTLFTKGNRVLVLSDEVHHAYSHLKFTGGHLGYDFDPEKIESTGRKTPEGEERLWMKYLREKPIQWHLGFTGTPYNQNEFFSDVIFNYSIKEAEDKYIKKINAVLSIEGGVSLTKRERFQQIIKTHYDNQRRYSYPLQGTPRLKPITIFISDRTKSAANVAEEFAQALAEHYGSNDPVCADKSRSELEVYAREKIIVVTTDSNKNLYQAQLDQIEETDPSKLGGKVEFISAVNKLSEGWDVDNVFQIVPAEEKVFNSKLLISQVLGRGLRLPRAVPFAQIVADYPTVTVTNHEKFGQHIQELYDEVTECELRFHSRVVDTGHPRAKHHFCLFNSTFTPTTKVTEVTASQPQARSLKLDSQPAELDVKINYLRDKNPKTFTFTKEFVTLGQVVNDVYRKFQNVAFEVQRFDFGADTQVNDFPSRENIAATIRAAMQEVQITGTKLSLENAKKVMLYFNQMIGTSKKKVERGAISHTVYGITTRNVPTHTTNSGRVGSDASLFLSEDYQQELLSDDLFVLEHIVKEAKSEEQRMRTGQVGLFVDKMSAQDIRPLIESRQVFLVNPSSFKTPTVLVTTSHAPERTFVIKLIEHAKYIDAWIKSPDSGFYSIEFDHWRKGKDRVRQSFNPDFFITTSTTRYRQQVTTQQAKAAIEQLEDKGVDTLVFVVEIKGESDESQLTKDKERAGKQHFADLSLRLLTQTNKTNLEPEFRDQSAQWYAFELVRHDEIDDWFNQMREGTVLVRSMSEDLGARVD